MVNVLGIGLDYLMLQDDKVRGDVRERQFHYAKHLESLNLIVYSPKELGFKNQKWADNLWIYPTNSKNKITFVFDAFRIASKICKERKIDVLTTEDPFSTGFIGYLLKRKFNLPLNVQVHINFCDNEYWIKLRKINRFFNRLGKFICKRADTIRLGTTKEKEKLTKLGIKEDKIFVCLENLNIEKFKRIDATLLREKFLNNKFDKILLFTGRLVLQKDIPVLLKAFKIVMREKPLTLLMIVGSGDQEVYLKQLAKELTIDKNVVFTGSIKHDRIPEYLSACDIYAVPSIFEGTCIAMAEAMVVEKPVVVTRFAGAEDLVEEGKTGFIVEQKDYETMAVRIISLLNNPEKAKEIGRNGSIYTKETFSNDKILKRIIWLWEQTVQGRNTPR